MAVVDAASSSVIEPTGSGEDAALLLLRPTNDAATLAPKAMLNAELVDKQLARTKQKKRSFWALIIMIDCLTC